MTNNPATRIMEKIATRLLVNRTDISSIRCSCRMGTVVTTLSSLTRSRCFSVVVPALPGPCWMRLRHSTMTVREFGLRSGRGSRCHSRTRAFAVFFAHRLPWQHSGPQIPPRPQCDFTTQSSVWLMLGFSTIHRVFDRANQQM